MGVEGHIHLAKNFGYKAFLDVYLDLTENIWEIRIRNEEVYFENDNEPGL